MLVQIRAVAHDSGDKQLCLGARKEHLVAAQRDNEAGLSRGLNLTQFDIIKWVRGLLAPGCPALVSLSGTRAQSTCRVGWQRGEGWLGCPDPGSNLAVI